MELLPCLFINEDKVIFIAKFRYLILRTLQKDKRHITNQEAIGQKHKNKKFN